MAIFLACSHYAQAAVFNIADGDVAGLISAINTSNANGQFDVINLAAGGAYTLSTVNNYIFSSNGPNGLPIVGDDVPGPDLTINGNGATIQRSGVGGTPTFRILQVGANAEVTINNVAIASGMISQALGNFSKGGGGILNDGSLTLVGCTLNSNSVIGPDGQKGTSCSSSGATGGAAQGGGVCSTYESSIVVIDCTFLLNSAKGGQGGDGFVYNVCSDICCWGNGGYGGSAEGGAIWVRNQKTLTIRGGSFASNSAVGGRGGAPGNPSGREGQAGNGNGGGIYADPETSATIDKTTVRQNNATDGGGIFFGRIGSAFVLTNSTLVGNTVTSKGGGLWLYANPTAATIKNCTFSDNVAGGCSAVGSGAALYNYVSLGQTTGGALVVGCTFNNNSITNLYSPSFLSLANTILKGGPCYQDVHDGGAGYSSQGFNISNTSAGGDAGTGPGGRLNGAGDIRNTDPMLDPAGLQNNGGPTQTIRLLAGSPAIDKGKSFGLGTDQRGRGRPDDDFAIANASGGDGSDIGAYEVPGSPQPGPALVVTAVDDHDDGGGASACTGDCTLREAINAANSIAGDKTITFASHVRGTTLLTSALPAVATNVNLQGPGARALEINGNNLYRVFSFTGGTSSVSGLTIANGRIPASGVPGASASGAGVFNQGTLSLSQCAITNCSVAGSFNLSGTGGSGNGGGVFNAGVLSMVSCTASGNTATGGGGGTSTRSGGLRGGSANGGGISNSAGTMTVTNCTVSGNSGTGGNGGSFRSAPGDGGDGYGGVYSTGGTLTLTACTVSGNNGTGGAGGIGDINGSPGLAIGGVRAGSTTTIRNTISAANTGGDVIGVFTSQGYNLIGPLGASTGFPGTADQTGVTNPGLGTLQNNGGPTDTRALLLSPTISPAIDKGNSFGLTIDQRGQLRMADSPSIPNASGGDAVDIGAFEFHPLSGADSDGDGMADDFETFYFGSITASNGTMDSDGDGLTDLQEFQAGTNPRDPNSNLRVIAVAKNGNDFSVTFSLAVNGKKYRLTRKDALSDSFWGTINGVLDVIPSVSGQSQIIDPNGASVTKRVYRVELVP